MRTRAAVTASALAAATLVTSSCNAPTVLESGSSFTTASILTGLEESATQTSYALADGNVWVGLTGSYQVRYDMAGSETLFVAGDDAGGRFVLLVGSQEGLPGACRFALRYGGIDQPGAIVAQGIRWPKARGFTAESSPRSDSRFTSTTIVCLDEHGRVTRTIEAPRDAADPAAGTAAP